MPQKQKLGIEKKVKIVKRYLAGKVSISTAAAEVGVGRETLQGWVMQYEAEGLEAFLPNRKNHTYSPELKLQAVQEYLSGKGSQAELSKKYGLRSKKQLHNWIKVYNAHGDFNSRKSSGGGSYMKQGREGHHAGRTCSDRQGLSGQWEKLRRDGLEVQGKLSTGTRLDAAV